MTSSTSNNGGLIVYKRKQKCTSSDASKSFPTEVISVNSKTSEAKADIDAPASAIAKDGLKKMVECDKSGMEHHGGAEVSDAYSGSTSAKVQQTQKEVNHNKLLILREVFQKSMEEELDMPKESDNEDSNEMPQLAPVYTPSGLALKEKYAKLRARQKERLLLRNARKVPLSSSRLVGPNQASDLHIFKLKGAAARHSSLMSLKGKNIIPNASLPKATWTGLTSGGSTSFHKNLNSAPLRRPAGFLKHKTHPNDWSELELDALWIGVRRYGEGNWERILADPTSKFFKNRTAQDLSTRWNKELLKISPFPKPISSILPTASVRNPHGPLNLNLQPMVAELMLQTLYPRADTKMNSNPVRMEAMQTPAISVAVKRNWFPARPEPNFMMGGYVQFPWVRENQNAGGDQYHPIVIEADSEEESSEWSETTLSG